MTHSQDDIITELENILGASAVISAPEAMPAYLEEPRKRFHQKALAVARPADTKAVQELAAWANKSRVSLVPQSGNTGLVGGQVPLYGNEIIVSLERLNAVREVDVDAGHMVVEAGVTLEGAQDAARDAGGFYPLAIASQGSARIGGVHSSNAGGVQVLAYGNARDLCLGLEAVLADGRLFSGLSPLRKNNTGYDLKNLLIGSEGTLGIITAATVKLFPAPEDHETALVNVASPAVAFALFTMMRDRAGQNLTAFELVPRRGIDFQLRHKMIASDPTAGPSPWYVLMEISRPRGGVAGVLESGLEAAFDAELIDNANIAQSLDQRQAMWAMRELMSDCQKREGSSIKHDVSVPVASIPELLERGLAVAEKIVPGIRPVPFGHLGDGNMHFNFSQPKDADGDAFMAGAEPLHQAIYAIVDELGGSFSAEHGVGQLKPALMRQFKDPVALEMMRMIKTAFDPNNILNPGKVLPD